MSHTLSRARASYIFPNRWICRSGKSVVRRYPCAACLLSGGLWLHGARGSPGRGFFCMDESQPAGLSFVRSRSATCVACLGSGTLDLPWEKNETCPHYSNGLRPHAPVASVAHTFSATLRTSSSIAMSCLRFHGSEEY